MKKLFVLAIIVCLAAACAINPQPQEAPTQTINVSCQLPNITPLPETKVLQEKGGVEIAVAAVAYEAIRTTVVETKDVEPPFIDRIITTKARENMRYVERTSRPALHVSPDRLRFRVTINNKLTRVFRGAGTVVQFNVGGKLIPIEQEGYAEFINVIVPPRSEQQVEIYGSRLQAVPAQTTIGIFLYDVVTKTDAAGNPTERQNFEWYFNYVTQLHEEVGTIQREQGWIK